MIARPDRLSAGTHCSYYGSHGDRQILRGGYARQVTASVEAYRPVGDPAEVRADPAVPAAHEFGGGCPGPAEIARPKDPPPGRDTSRAGAFIMPGRASVRRADDAPGHALSGDL